MNQLTDILFSEVNITLTVLLILLIVYWIITMIGGLDYDLDVDIEVDADIDFDAGIEGGNLDFEDISNAEVNKDDVIGKKRKPLKKWQIFLIYFNFVGLPFMFTFTFWIFVWWFATTILTTLTGTYENYIGFIIMIAVLIPALFINKSEATVFPSALSPFSFVIFTTSSADITFSCCFLSTFWIACIPFRTSAMVMSFVRLNSIGHGLYPVDPIDKLSL